MGGPWRLAGAVHSQGTHRNSQVLHREPINSHLFHRVHGVFVEAQPATDSARSRGGHRAS